MLQKADNLRLQLGQNPLIHRQKIALCFVKTHGLYKSQSFFKLYRTSHVITDVRTYCFT